MTSKQILDSIYIIPVLLDHMDNPRIETARVLGHAGIGKSKLEEMKKIRPLLEYHFGIIRNDFNKSGDAYVLLRDGLKTYFDQYLSKIWFELGIRDTDKRLLDYGAGAGQYSDKFLEENMAGDVMMVDKEVTRPDMVQIDFEKDPSWYDPHREQFDLVLLAEVLHCKDEAMQKHLIQTSRMLLKPNGHLIIVENIDHAMAYRISRLKGEPRPVLDEKEIQALIETENGRFKEVSKLQIEQHKIYRYEKV